MRETIPGIKKFILHLEHIKKIIQGIPTSPINVSIWTTSRCQCNCSFCCFKNDLKNTNEISLPDFKNCLDVLKKYGTKSIEFSGGGEPLLWTHFNEGVEYAYEKGFKLSLMTNGYLLKKISDEMVSKFQWIRVSIHSYNHFNLIDFDRLSKLTKISTSYIISDMKEFEELDKIFPVAKEKNIVVRIAVNRPTTEKFESSVEEKIRKYGLPFFFSVKSSESPLGCYMPWIKGAIDWRSMFLPCPSIQFNSTDGKVPDNFALCHINDLEKWILNTKPHDLGYKCKFCNCGKEHNDLIHNLMNGMEDVDFI